MLKELFIKNCHLFNLILPKYQNHLQKHTNVANSFVQKSAFKAAKSI